MNKMYREHKLYCLGYLEKGQDYAVYGMGGVSRTLLSRDFHGPVKVLIVEKIDEKTRNKNVR